jgi:iron complex outermembrane receptor protein
VQLLGNSDEDEEQLRAFELGYRFSPAPAFSLDITGFYNEYRDLLAYVHNPVAIVEMPPPTHVLVSSTYQNVGRAQTYGAEIEAQWTPTAGWRLVTSYSGLRMHVRPDATQDTGSPRHQAQLRTYVTLPRQIELNGTLMYVDRLTVTPSVSAVNVPAYARLDLGAGWRPVGTLELGVWGQNLLQPRHFEFPSVQNAQATDIPRNFLARVTWRF